ncbi:hypothetical protein [Dongia sp.]|uniref:hypothetical protein n=1 Tax=Dongia sp. TaxID=1977262 RepID=UPI0035B045E0
MEQAPKSSLPDGGNPIYWLVFAISALVTGISGLFLIFAGSCVLVTGDGHYSLDTLIFLLALIGIPLILTLGGLKLCQWLWRELHPEGE